MSGPVLNTTGPIALVQIHLLSGPCGTTTDRSGLVEFVKLVGHLCTSAMKLHCARNVSDGSKECTICNGAGVYYNM